jgi:hypothetical protein
MQMGLTLGGAKHYLMQVWVHFAGLAQPLPSPSFLSISAPPVLPPILKAADNFTELLFGTSVHGASKRFISAPIPEG